MLLQTLVNTRILCFLSVCARNCSNNSNSKRKIKGILGQMLWNSMLMDEFEIWPPCVDAFYTKTKLTGQWNSRDRQLMLSNGPNDDVENWSIQQY